MTQCTNCTHHTHQTPTIRKRIATDLYLTYILKENGQEIDLAARENISVTIVKGTTEQRTENYIINGSTITIQLSAKDNNSLGRFSLRIEYDLATAISETGRTHLIHDIPQAYEIVSRSTQETPFNNTTVESTILRFGQDGADAFQTWKHYANRPEATYEDYLTAMRQPLTEINAQYDNGYLTLTL